MKQETEEKVVRELRRKLTDRENEQMTDQELGMLASLDTPIEELVEIVRQWV
jgi:hypothetical protein